MISKILLFLALTSGFASFICNAGIENITDIQLFETSDTTFKDEVDDSFDFYDPELEAESSGLVRY